MSILVYHSGFFPARVMRTYLKDPATARNIPIQAIGLSLYESLPGTTAEKLGSEVIRTQWLYVSDSSVPSSFDISTHVLALQRPRDQDSVRKACINCRRSRRYPPNSPVRSSTDNAGALLKDICSVTLFRSCRRTLKESLPFFLMQNGRQQEPASRYLSSTTSLNLN